MKIKFFLIVFTLSLLFVMFSIQIVGTLRKKPTDYSNPSELPDLLDSKTPIALEKNFAIFEEIQT
jgi:hypothetical protein